MQRTRVPIGWSLLFVLGAHLGRRAFITTLLHSMTENDVYIQSASMHVRRPERATQFFSPACSACIKVAFVPCGAAGTAPIAPALLRLTSETLPWFLLPSSPVFRVLLCVLAFHNPRV